MDCEFDTLQSHRRFHKIGIAYGNCGKADEAVKTCDEFGHLRHLDTTRQDDADAAADQKCDQQECVVLRNNAQYGREQRDRHTRDPVPVAASCGLLIGKPPQGQDKENRCSDVRDGNDAGANHVNLTS